MPVLFQDCSKNPLAYVIMDECAVQDSTGASMPQIWAAMRADDDLWPDAAMEEVCMYVRGARALRVPQELRQALGMNG